MVSGIRFIPLRYEGSHCGSEIQDRECRSLASRAHCATRYQRGAVTRQQDHARRSTAVRADRPNLPASRQAALWERKWRAESRLKGPSQLICRPLMLQFERSCNPAYPARTGGASGDATDGRRGMRRRILSRVRLPAFSICRRRCRNRRRGGLHYEPNHSQAARPA